MKEMSEVCSDSFLHSIIGMLTTWSAAQGHSHNLTHIAVQLPIAKVRFVAVSATIPNIQVQFLPLGCYSYALGYNQACKTKQAKLRPRLKQRMQLHFVPLNLLTRDGLWQSLPYSNNMMTTHGGTCRILLIGCKSHQQG